MLVQSPKPLGHPVVGVIARSDTSYTRLAETTGYHRAWISRVARGLAPASPAFRSKVADALGHPETDLFDNEHEVAIERHSAAIAALLDDRERQGFPRTVTDPQVLADVAAVLAAVRRKAQTP